MPYMNAVRRDAYAKRFRSMDGLYMKLTDRFSVFVTPRYPNQNAEPDDEVPREWQLLDGHGRKVVMRGTNTGTDASVMCLALERTTAWFASEKHDFCLADAKMTKIGEPA